MISIQSVSVLPLSDVVSRSVHAGEPEAEHVLRQCILRSTEMRYGLVDGEVACMWGLIPPTLLSTTAYLWLFTTHLVDEHKFLFVRHSQRYIEEALKTYPVIIGDVALDNLPARRWLAWLGAQFSAPDRGMIRFTITRKLLNG